MYRALFLTVDSVHRRVVEVHNACARRYLRFLAALFSTSTPFLMAMAIPQSSAFLLGVESFISRDTSFNYRS